MSMLQENPGRPPKAWFHRCETAVKRRGGAYDPKAVCGAQWQRKSESEKRRLSRGRLELEENPISGATTALVVVGAALVFYLLFARKSPIAPAVAAPAPPPPSVPSRLYGLDLYGI